MRLSHPRNGENEHQGTVLARSINKQSDDYDTGRSNHQMV